MEPMNTIHWYPSLNTRSAHLVSFPLKRSAAVQKLPELGEFLLRDVGALPHGLVDLLGTFLDRAADAGKDLEEPARLAVGLGLGDGADERARGLEEAALEFDVAGDGRGDDRAPLRPLFRSAIASSSAAIRSGGPSPSSSSMAGASTGPVSFALVFRSSSTLSRRLSAYLPGSNSASIVPISP